MALCLVNLYMSENNQKEVTLVVCGSRSITEKEIVKEGIREAIKKFNEREETISQVLTGGADGVDSVAKEWVSDKDIQYEEIEPKWEKYGGKRAPIERNKKLIEKADYIVAVWDGKSSGTKFMIDNAGETPLYVKLEGTKKLDSF